MRGPQNVPSWEPKPPKHDNAAWENNDGWFDDAYWRHQVKKGDCKEEVKKW